MPAIYVIPTSNSTPPVPVRGELLGEVQQPDPQQELDCVNQTGVMEPNVHWVINFCA